jgi:EpsI family protein
MAAGGQHLAAVGGETTGAHPNTSAVPLHLGDWQGVDTVVSAEELARLDRTAELRRTFRDPAGDWIWAGVVYSTQWKGLHAAESCLTGAGWSVIKQYETNVECGGKNVPATVLVNRDSKSRGMVELYMFVNRQGVTANWIDQFWMLIKNRGHGEMACHFILNGPIQPGHTPEQVAGQLEDFAHQMLPYVQKSLESQGSAT